VYIIFGENEKVNKVNNNYCFFGLFSCNPFCSGKEIKEEDKRKIELINSDYLDYNIEINRCLPKGYVNVFIRAHHINEFELERILLRIIESKISADRIRVFDKEEKFMRTQELNATNLN